MSEPIKVGDLVVVVRGHRCGIGRIFRVKSFLKEDGRGIICTLCRERIPTKKGELLVRDEVGHPRSVWRLKRIPPLSELDDVKKDEEIHA